MKKIGIGLLSVMIILMAVCFSSADTLDCTDCKSFNFAKAYKLINENTISPDETFSFKIEKAGVAESEVSFDNMPTFEQSTFQVTHQNGSAEFTSEGKKVSTEVKLPEFNRVGIYKYKISEIPGNTAGVKYSDKKVILTIYVTNCAKIEGSLDRTYTMALEDGEDTKVDGVTNTYSAGSLEVTKTVTGIMGDTKKYFNVDVTFNVPKGKICKGLVSFSNGQGPSSVDLKDGKETVRIQIKDGETVKFSNIPYGVTYSVKEADYSDMGYETTYSDNADGSIDSADTKVDITNSKGGDIKTGLIYDTMKYVIAALAVAVMSIVVIFRRRKIKE